MLALLAHITMEEEPLLALIAGVGAVGGALGVIVGSVLGGRRRAAKDRVDS